MKTKRGEIKGNAHILLLFLVMMIFFMIVAVLYLYNITESKPEIDFNLNLNLNFSHKFTGFAIGDKDIDSVMVSVNAGEEVGRVREDFYGVNTHGRWLREGARINNGSSYLSNLTWHRETFLEGGYSYSREDMGLGNFYNNGTGNWSILRKGNTTSITKEYEWARQNGVKILNIIDYMPEWLADNSSGKCLNLKFCPPLNYTYYGELVKDYINRTTLDGEYLDVVEYEFWNEPDISFLLGGYPNGHEQKAIEYVKMHNITRNILKETYSSICIGGPSPASIWNTKITDNYLSNFSDDCFFSFHNYISPKNTNIYSSFQSSLNTISSKCDKYEANCSRIILSEFNLGHSSSDDWIKNTSSRSNEYGAYYSLFYASVLNSYPENVSMITYQWADSVVYGTGYPEYPHQWYSVQEPALGLEYKPSYNVTKDFAHYHASGNMIINSSSSNNSVKVVASVNPSNILHVTVINTGTNNVSVSVNLSSIGVNEIKDLATEGVYPVSDGIADVGVLRQYDVKHYEGIITIIDEDIEEIPAVIDETPEEVKKSDIGNKIVPLSEILSPINLNNQVISTRKIISSAKNLISKSKETKEDEINSDGITSLAINESENESAEGVEGIEEETEENSNQTVIATSDLLIYNEDINFEDDEIQDYTNTESESSTSKTSKKSSKSLKQESEIAEEFESEVERTSLSNFISKASVIEDNPIVIITLLLSIGIVTLILIYIIKRRRKQKLSCTYTPDMINKLDDWIKRARSLGYTDNLMKSMLEKSGWDEKMVRKGLGEN